MITHGHAAAGRGYTRYMTDRKGRRRLCRVEDLPRGEAIGAPLPGGEPGWQDELILLRHGDALRAYHNSCPHTGAPLNWLPNRFFDDDGRYLQCSLHMALFEPGDGLCVSGPCVGQCLQEIDIIVVDGEVRLAEDRKPD